MIFSKKTRKRPPMSTPRSSAKRDPLHVGWAIMLSPEQLQLVLGGFEIAKGSELLPLMFTAVLFGQDGSAMWYERMKDKEKVAVVHGCYRWFRNEKLTNCSILMSVDGVKHTIAVVKQTGIMRKTLKIWSCSAPDRCLHPLSFSVATMAYASTVKYDKDCRRMYGW